MDLVIANSGAKISYQNFMIFGKNILSGDIWFLLILFDFIYFFIRSIYCFLLSVLVMLLLFGGCYLSVDILLTCEWFFYLSVGDFWRWNKVKGFLDKGDA